MQYHKREKKFLANVAYLREVGETNLKKGKVITKLENVSEETEDWVINESGLLRNDVLQHLLDLDVDDGFYPAVPTIHKDAIINEKKIVRAVSSLSQSPFA
jgi:hypothetical protein